MNRKQWSLLEDPDGQVSEVIPAEGPSIAFNWDEGGQEIAWKLYVRLNACEELPKAAEEVSLHVKSIDDNRLSLAWEKLSTLVKAIE